MRSEKRNANAGRVGSGEVKLDLDLRAKTVFAAVHRLFSQRAGYHTALWV